MQRDMNLVRDILLAFAESDGHVSIDRFVDEQRPRPLVGYHFQIMDEAGLIVATIQSAGNDPYYFVRGHRLTWEGNDFLDAIRSEKIWNRVIKAVGNASESASLEVFKVIASDLATEAIKSLL